MQEFDHIEALWAKHTVDVKISADEMLSQAKKEVNTLRNKSMLNIVGMVLSFLAVACLWFFNFQAWTTHLGISIIVLVVAVYSLILYNNHRIIAKNDITANPNQFLNSLKIYQLDRLSLYNKLYWFYTIALSLGMVFFFVEILNHMQLWAQITLITISVAWMIFCSTLVRKAVIKRDKERIALLIEKFERISAQFKDQG
ncbi:MAG: hypothetical protein EOO07_11685 [Chitinophagaceae bacterium]|nr:MAG: hypothetical protein EOO07_11685 [Chitinophagaceae bacterium]